MKDVTKLKKALQKALPEFVDSVESTSTEALKSSVSQLALNINKVEEDRDGNEKIVQLREALLESTGPYKDTLGVLRKKIKYIAHILEERGAQ